MAKKLIAADVRAKAERIASAPASARAAMGRATKPDVEALSEQLGTQYDWLNDHPEHPNHETYFEQWRADLTHYEAACNALNQITQLELVA